MSEVTLDFYLNAPTRCGIKHYMQSFDNQNGLPYPQHGTQSEDSTVRLDSKRLFCQIKTQPFIRLEPLYTFCAASLENLAVRFKSGSILFYNNLIW